MTMRQNTVRAVKGESTIRRAAEKFCRNKLAVISLIILLVLILLAVFAEKICTYDPLAENYKENGMIDKYSAPSAEHILGTDSIGRDVFARLLTRIVGRDVGVGQAEAHRINAGNETVKGIGALIVRHRARLNLFFDHLAPQRVHAVLNDLPTVFPRFGRNDGLGVV